MTRDPEPPAIIPVLKTNEPAWLCHTYDGRPFWCDTDFKRRLWETFGSLLEQTWEEHICLTGGEPLMHLDKVEEFIKLANDRDIMIHIETSGTIEMECYAGRRALWVSVAPKKNVLPQMIDSADEIKLLIDERFDIHTLSAEIINHENVYIQPINDEMMVSRPNFALCMEVLKKYPRWKLSVQQHKLLGLR